MSVQTIKGVRQKTGQNSYPVYVPFGVDGEYTDMLSGLTLEKEIKMGGDHLTTISTQQDGSTLITEKYAPNATTVNYYQLVTNISQVANVGTVIASTLSWIDNSQTSNIKNTKRITIQNGTVTSITEELTS